MDGEEDELTLITLFSRLGQCLLDEELCEQAYELRTSLIALLESGEVPERHGNEGLSHVMVDVIASYLCSTVPVSALDTGALLGCLNQVEPSRLVLTRDVNALYS
jgi:hypothetical protein